MMERMFKQEGALEALLRWEEMENDEEEQVEDGVCEEVGGIYTEFEARQYFERLLAEDVDNKEDIVVEENDASQKEKVADEDEEIDNVEDKEVRVEENEDKQDVRGEKVLYNKDDEEEYGCRSGWFGNVDKDAGNIELTEDKGESMIKSKNELVDVRNEKDMVEDEKSEDGIIVGIRKSRIIRSPCWWKSRCWMDGATAAVGSRCWWKKWCWLDGTAADVGGSRRNSRWKSWNIRS